MMARKLVELHFKAQLKVMISESKLKNVQKDLYAVQGDMASGSHIEFYVKPDLMGLVIGKKGVRIQSVEKINGIKSVNIDGSTGKISISGPDSSTVQSAREFLELFEESFDIQPIHAEWLSKDRMNGSLTDIKTAADLMVAKVDREKNQLVVIGTGPAVRSARTFLATQLEYINKQIGIETTVQSTREQLFSFKKQYGIDYRGDGRGRGDRGGRGDRSDGRGGDGRGRGDRGDRGDSRGDSRKGPSSLTSLPPPPEKKRDDPLIPPPVPSQQQTNREAGSRYGNRSGRDTLQDINSLTNKVGNISISNDVRQQDKDKAAAKPSAPQNNGRSDNNEKTDSSRRRPVGGKGKSNEEKDKKATAPPSAPAPAPVSAPAPPKQGAKNPIDEVTALIKGNPVKGQEDVGAGAGALPKRVRKSKSGGGKDSDIKANETTTTSAPATASTPTVPKKESSSTTANKEDTSAKGLSIREARKKKEAATIKAEPEKS